MQNAGLLISINAHSEEPRRTKILGIGSPIWPSDLPSRPGQPTLALFLKSRFHPLRFGPNSSKQRLRTMPAHAGCVASLSASVGLICGPFDHRFLPSLPNSLPIGSVGLFPSKRPLILTVNGG